jgi:hypothetical protein
LHSEHGEIQVWGFAESEGPPNWQILHYLLRKRWTKQGAKSVNDVIGCYDDLGSANLKDPKQHWVTKIWSNVTRVPRKDAFHGMKLVTNSTDGASHPLHESFCQDFTDCILFFEKSSIEAAAKQYVRENPNTRMEVTWMEGIKLKRWKQKMYNQSRYRAVAARKVHQTLDKFKEEDKKYVAKGFWSYFRMATPKSQSTEQEIEAFISYIERGDYEDPLQWKHMSFSH